MTEQFPAALAPSTANNYLRLATRLENFAGEQRDPWGEQVWIDFIHSLRIAPTSRLAYLKCASAILALRSRSLLSLALRQSCAQGGLVAVRQAPPAKREHLDHPMLVPHRLGLLLAWKSASRWDEISRLYPEHILISQSDLIVDWGQSTKSSRLDPHRASRWTVIRGNDLPEITTLLKACSPQRPITSLSTTALTRLLRLAFPGEGLSAHSIKAGAVDVVARGVQAGALPLSTLHRLAKHATTNDPPATTLRYVRDHAVLARMLGTGEATQLL